MEDGRTHRGEDLRPRFALAPSERLSWPSEQPLLLHMAQIDVVPITNVPPASGMSASVYVPFVSVSFGSEASGHSIVK